ncbi:hypothetical protein RHMOL_Rhmol11G0035600 [Rhododendron molle]|uniref:Uncharacterized protein n=1 Tax=Rhododendron molle TaxID=49168 RepID=A0ACC0LN27_RHOML|nr:hypothetical protein RHMOL_Rhmol11G0035600 [Rhododendron molle]
MNNDVHLWLQPVLSSPNFNAGLAHPVIVISSNSKSSGDDSRDLFIREYLERRRSRRQTSSIASNMSDSSDSNAERDYEYNGGFNTEPKMSFTPSTHSDAEPQLGPKVESRFHTQVEATTSARSGHSETPSENREVTDLYETGQVCPYAHYFSGAQDNRAITKREQSLAVEKNVETLKAQICHDAPTLLGYIPSYKGKLKRREKEGEQRPIGESQEGERAEEKFPTFRKTADFWFQKSRPTDIPGINTPLQTLIPKFGEQMGRRNVVRVNIRDSTTVRHKETDVTELVEKRQKFTHEFFLTRPPMPFPREKDQTESSAVGGSKAAEKSVGLAGRAIVQEFVPSFAMAEGRVVTIEDSVKLEPGLAVTMLHGLA